MGSKRCEPGCECKRHSRGSAIDWNDPEARKQYNRDKAREKYAADPEPWKDASQRWRERNPGYRAMRKRVLGSMSAADLKWMYGVTPERVAELAVVQGGSCYLCGDPLDFGTPRKVHIDHDHACCRGRRSCGKCVRGLACHPCNTGVGIFGDDPERMRRVANNLEAANRRLRKPARTG